MRPTLIKLRLHRPQNPGIHGGEKRPTNDDLIKRVKKKKRAYKKITPKWLCDMSRSIMLLSRIRSSQY